MGLVRAGSDENGEYIEISRPKGETHPCFIDEGGTLRNVIRIYRYRDVKTGMVVDDICVMCGKQFVPEGYMVCNECREAFGI